jgi:hypothetical protein
LRAGLFSDRICRVLRLADEFCEEPIRCIHARVSTGPIYYPRRPPPGERGPSGKFFGIKRSSLLGTNFYIRKNAIASSPTRVLEGQQPRQLLYMESFGALSGTTCRHRPIFTLSDETTIFSLMRSHADVQGILCWSCRSSTATSHPFIRSV